MGLGNHATWPPTGWHGLRPSATEPPVRQRFLQLLKTATAHPSPLHPSEAVQAFRAYLLATTPAERTTAYTPASGAAIGCSQPDSVALLSLHQETFFTAGTAAAQDLLSQWFTAWRTAGRPGFDHIRPVVTRTPQGYRIQAMLSS